MRPRRVLATLIVLAAVQPVAACAGDAADRDLCTQYAELVTAVEEIQQQAPLTAKAEDQRQASEEVQAELDQLQAVSEGRLDNAISTLRANVDAVRQAAIAAGENVHQPRTEPPLTIAAAKGHLAIVRELLAAGAKASATDSMGRQALVYAKTPQVAKALLEAGADSDHVSKWGNAALHVAAANGQTAYAKVLLAQGAKVDVRDKEGQTPLMRAAMPPYGEM